LDDTDQRGNLVLNKESVDEIFGFDSIHIDVYTKAFNDSFCNFQTRNSRRIPQNLLDAMQGVDTENVSVEIIGLLGYSAAANLTRPNKWHEPFAKYPITKFFEKEYSQKDRLLIQEDFNRVKNAVAGYSSHGVSYRVEVTLRYNLNAELGSSELSHCISESLNTSLCNIKEYCLQEISPKLKNVPKEIFPGVLQVYTQFFAVIIEMLASLHYSNSLTVYQIEFACVIERLLMFLLNGNPKNITHSTFKNLGINQSIEKYNFPFVKTDFIDVENLSLQDAYGLDIFLSNSSSIQEIRLGREGGKFIHYLSAFEKDIFVTSRKLQQALESTNEQLLAGAISQVNMTLSSFISLLITQMSEWYRTKLKDRTSLITGNIILTDRVRSYLLFNSGVDFFARIDELLELNAFTKTQSKIEAKKFYSDFMESNIMAGWNLPEWFYAHRVRSMILKRLFVFLPYEAKLKFQHDFMKAFVDLKYFPLFGKSSNWMTYGKFCEISSVSLVILQNTLTRDAVTNSQDIYKRPRMNPLRNSPLVVFEDEAQHRPCSTITLPGNSTNSHFQNHELDEYYKITKTDSYLTPFESAMRNEKKRLVKCVELPTEIVYQGNRNLPKHYLFLIYTCIVMSHMQPILSGNINGSIKVSENKSKVSKTNYVTTLFCLVLKQLQLVREIIGERFKKRYQYCHINRFHVMIVFKTANLNQMTICKLGENFDELEFATRQGNLNLLEFFHLQ